MLRELKILLGILLVPVLICAQAPNQKESVTTVARDGNRIGGGLDAIANGESALVQIDVGKDKPEFTKIVVTQDSAFVRGRTDHGALEFYEVTSGVTVDGFWIETVLGELVQGRLKLPAQLPSSDTSFWEALLAEGQRKRPGETNPGCPTCVPCCGGVPTGGPLPGGSIPAPVPPWHSASGDSVRGQK